MPDGRKIIHIDMDSFYASVEQRDHPEYRGKPIIVGGDPDKRGVVSTASYEARKFGVRSAMAASTARRLCPHALFLRPRMEAYGAASREIMAILREYSDLVQPVSIDEAYLDVTVNKKNIPFASKVARAIKEDIHAQVSLTASAGVGPNKFIAKIASDMNKPDGLTVIQPAEVEGLLAELPVRKVPGIGRVTEAKMKGLGILTVGDLRLKSKDELSSRFGKVGPWYYALARGEDRREVAVGGARKSIGAERTFAVDMTDADDMRNELRKLALWVEKRMVKAGVKGKTITLKITYADFQKITRSTSLDHYIDDADTLYDAASNALPLEDGHSPPLRLLGISASNLDNAEIDLVDENDPQLTLSFD